MEVVEIETQCPNPKCKTGIENLRVRELRELGTNELIDWHQCCVKCNTHFTQRWRWIEHSVPRQNARREV